MSNPNPLNQFKPGDPRINRRGRPKSFDAWRALAKSIVAEPAQGKDGLVLIKIPLIKNGAPVLDENGNVVMVDHYATNAEMIARTWLKDPKHQTELIEAAFGKVPQQVDMTSGGEKIIVTIRSGDE